MVYLETMNSVGREAKAAYVTCTTAALATALYCAGLYSLLRPSQPDCINPSHFGNDYALSFGPFSTTCHEIDALWSTNRFVQRSYHAGPVTVIFEQSESLLPLKPFLGIDLYGTTLSVGIGDQGFFSQLQ